MLVNRRFPTEFLQGRELLAPRQGEAVHVCTWPGTSEEAEKAKGREGIGVSIAFRAFCTLRRREAVQALEETEEESHVQAERTIFPQSESK